MPERDIEKDVCAYARYQGLGAYKFRSPGRRNIPDRIFFCQGGHIFFMEFKREGAKPTGGQLREHWRLREKGFRVYVVDNVEAGRRIIDEWVAFLRTAPPVPAPCPEFLT